MADGYRGPYIKIGETEIRITGEIKFQEGFDVDRLSKAKGYPYGEASKINYKDKANKKKKVEKAKKEAEKKKEAKKKSIFDIIDFGD